MKRISILRGLQFYLVDVFAQERYAGNQLAVFVDAGDLTSSQMQQLANEMHFSETTFILSRIPEDGGYNVRIFTPFNELPFAGHPTLGTAYIIKRFIGDGDVDHVVLNLKVGQIPVTVEKQSGVDTLWMKQVQPSFDKTFPVAQFARVLQLSEDDFNRRFQIQEVSTGIPFIIVPLKSLDAVKRARINMTYLREMASDVHGGILVFAPKAVHVGNDLHVRVFVDLYGIPEDPATGSGNGCLASYLSQHRYFGGDKVDVRVEQGYEIRRPSLLLLRAQKIGATFDVEVGGQVFLVGDGKLA